MPVDSSGVGVSNVTLLKQEHYENIFLKIVPEVKRMIEKSNSTSRFYHVYDLCSGAGTYVHPDYKNLPVSEQKIMPGSPLIFLKIAHKYGLPVNAFFSDKEKKSTKSLRKIIIDSYRVTTLPNSDLEYPVNYADRPINNQIKIYNGDFEDERGMGQYFEICRRVSRSQYGHVYYDPNGSYLPVDFFNTMFNLPCFRYVDLVINYSGTALKRHNGYLKSKANSIYSPNQGVDLEEMLGQIKDRKRYWIIRKPYGPWHWTFLIGTNWDNFPIFEDDDFAPLCSNEGIRYFEKAAFTKDELSDGRKMKLYLPLLDYGKKIKTVNKNSRGNIKNKVYEQGALFTV